MKNNLFTVEIARFTVVVWLSISSDVILFCPRPFRLIFV